MRRHFGFLWICLCTVFFLSSSSLKAKEDTAIIVCDNSLEMFEWDLEFVRQAKQSVEWSACFAGGKILQRMLAVMEERLQACPNLQVSILTTPIFITSEDQEFIDRLWKLYPNNFHLEHASNVPMVWPEVAAIDNHLKILVVDEKYFSVGGSNFEDALCSDGTFTPPRNPRTDPIHAGQPAGVRDQDVVGRGPIAKQLREAFYSHCALWKHYNETKKLERDPAKFKENNGWFPLDPAIARPVVSSFEMSEDKIASIDETEVKMFLGGPHQKFNDITQEYIRLINSAKEEIVIANLYFSPPEPLAKAIYAAVKRGVKLTVITNGVYDDSPMYNQFTAWANRVSYTPIFYGQTFHFWDAWSAAKKEVKNTQVFEYRVPDILYHKKVMVIDGETFVIGGYNTGIKSHIADYEIILVFNSFKAAQTELKILEKDKALSERISPKQAFDWYFNPVTSFLGESQKRFHGLL